MPALTLPDIMPTSRSFTEGRYPQQEFQALNGATTILRYGNQPSGAELALGYDNIADGYGGWFVDVYNQQHTIGDGWVVLTVADALGGMEASLASLVAKANTGQRWRFAEPPTVESTFRRLCSVRIKLLTYLDA